MVEKVKNEKTITRTDEKESEILREYEDGTRLLGIRLSDEKTWTRGSGEYHDRYRVVAADGRSRDILGGMNMDRRRVAQELAALFYRFGYIHEERKDIVPITVAVAGKPAIAAYLNAVLSMSLDEIADKMDVSGNTAYQYVDHFKEGRR